MTSSDPIDPLVSEYARASVAAVTRARPIVFISVSGGVAEDALYKPDGTYYGDDEDLPVKVILIDWDNVEGEVTDDPDFQYAIPYVKSLLEDEELPENIKLDIRTSLDHALRWEEPDVDE